jgi:hypothetical protein
LPFQFSEKYSISQYFPFKYLARSEIITIPESGFIMTDDFDFGRIFSRWHHLWAQVENGVKLNNSREGYGQTKCLTVQNNNSKAWSLSPGALIQVTKGDMISFQALVMKEFITQSISLQLRGYDETRKETAPKLARTEKEPVPGKWELLRMEMLIPEGIRFITPKIRGAGSGLFKIDNIEISKEKQSDNHGPET